MLLLSLSGCSVIQYCIDSAGEKRAQREQREKAEQREQKGQREQATQTTQTAQTSQRTQQERPKATQPSPKKEGAQISLADELEKQKAMTKASEVIEYSKKFLGVPYRTAGKGPNGFDCSGFTSYVFRQVGIELSSSSQGQFAQGKAIERSEIRPGDLVFFCGRAINKTISHVGLITEVNDKDFTFIHAAVSGGVRYDHFPDLYYYKDRLLGFCRVL